MYNERNESFSIKDIILQLLFVVLFVLVLIWLFPTRGAMEKKLEGVKVDADLSGLESQLEVLTNRIFAENINTMKEADISYSGLTLTAPFTLVVTAQQSGFDWNNTQTES